MSRQKGFTLIEVIMVIVIIGLVTASSAAFYAKFYGQSSLTQTTDALIEQLRKAQLYAMTGRLGGNWGIHNGLNQIILFQGNSYGQRDASFDEIMSIYQPTIISGFTDIVFYKTGTPSATGTITVSAASTVKTITVGSMGVINR